MTRRFEQRQAMSQSVEASVGAALALQGFNIQQETQMLLLRKTLDHQAQAIAQVMDTMPALATEGALGTRINTYA